MEYLDDALLEDEYEDDDFESFGSFEEDDYDDGDDDDDDDDDDGDGDGDDEDDHVDDERR